MENRSGFLAWSCFSSSIWPPNFIKHSHCSSSGAPNPVLWDMANRFAAAGPGTTCHQPGAGWNDRRLTLRIFLPKVSHGTGIVSRWTRRFWQSKSSLGSMFNFWGEIHGIGSMLWQWHKKTSLLQWIVGQIQAFQMSAGLQSCFNCCNISILWRDDRPV